MTRIFSLLSVFACWAFAIEASPSTNQYQSNIWAAGRIENIKPYEDGLGPIFTFLQGNDYFAIAALSLIFAVIGAFILHFLIIGPKHFSHDGKKVYAFNMIERVSHGAAAIAWIVLIHGLATILFAVSVPPMLIAWTVRMLPAVYDIRWMLIVGGYLSKIKRPVPAGKFNAGQKAWYWVAIPGGIVMILTGAAMFFLDFRAPDVASWLGVSQIEILRASALIHNVLGIVCAVFFLVHIYMAAIAIHGAIWSMITGYKEEEEVYVLHHYWYQELISKNKIPVSEYEKTYAKLK